MILTFYAGIITLTLVALGFLLWPLWVINPDTVPGGKQKPSLRNITVAGLCIVSLPVIAWSIYACIGASQQLRHFWVLQHESQLTKMQMAELHIHNPQQLIAKLREHLVQQPNSAQGWYLLGRLYFRLQDYPQALQAMRRAQQLAPQKLDYGITLAEISFLLHQNQLDHNMLELVKHILQQQPQNVDAINLLAWDAYSKQNYQQAVKYWEGLLPIVQADSQDGRELLQMLGKAQQKLQQQKLK